MTKTGTAHNTVQGSFNAHPRSWKATVFHPRGIKTKTRSRPRTSTIHKTRHLIRTADQAQSNKKQVDNRKLPRKHYTEVSTFEETVSATLFVKRMYRSPFVLAWPRRVGARSSVLSIPASVPIFCEKTKSNPVEGREYDLAIVYDWKARPTKWSESVEQSCYKSDKERVAYASWLQRFRTWQLPSSSERRLMTSLLKTFSQREEESPVPFSTRANSYVAGNGVRQDRKNMTTSSLV